MNKLYVVYNTCGIYDKDNTDRYIQSIESILNQRFDDFKLVLSSCIHPRPHLDKLHKVFGNNMNYCHYNDKYTVNTTFNKTVKEMVKQYGPAEGYLYIDSGCILQDDHTIQKMYDYFKSDNYAMVSLATDTDTGFHLWFGRDIRETFIVPVGKAINLHVQIFHNDLLNTFNNIIPDIFATYCTESTFSFLCEAISKKWLMIMDTHAQHWHGMDGGSAGFIKNPGWWDILPGARPISDIIGDPEATACGFGYEECQNIKPHYRDAYDENYNCKDPARLAKFIKENIFLSKDVLDYDKIKCEFK